MSKTIRKKSVWHRHEDPDVRRRYNKQMRLKNKKKASEGEEVERNDKTRGWLTW